MIHSLIRYILIFLSIVLLQANASYAPKENTAAQSGGLKTQSLRILKNGVEIGVARFEEATQRFIHTFKEGFGLSDELQYATSDGLSFSQRELDDLNVNYHKNNVGGGGGNSIPEGFKITTKFGYQHGQKVYEYKGRYYSKDVDSHNGGVWKVFEAVGGKLKRIGTADANLNIFKN